MRCLCRSFMHSTARLFLVPLTIVVLVMACTSEGSEGERAITPAPSLSPVSGINTEYFISQPDGSTRAVSRAEIDAVLPFKIVVPQFLPRGMRLDQVYVLVPPDHLSETDKRRRTRALLAFGNLTRTAVFQLEESILEEDMNPVGIEGPGTKGEIIIAGVKGAILEDTERQSLDLAWHGCGVSFVLSTTIARELTKEEDIRIAESTISGRC